MDATDWDLLAVVRGCATPTTTTTSPETTAKGPDLNPLFPSQNRAHFQTPINPFETLKSAPRSDDLGDLLLPFCPDFTTISAAANTSRTAAMGGGEQTAAGLIRGEQRGAKEAHFVFGNDGNTSAFCTAIGNATSQKTKKRKNVMKKVCHVAAEGVSSDEWAWRKYGQKPIKGSPYPRGYYKCSSFKGCLARKQVERNRSDPEMFIVTYTADHNHPMPTHRNSLAGTTRHKPTSSTTATATTAAAVDNPTEKSESKTEEKNEMGLSDIMLNDDFFVGFEELDGSDAGECFSCYSI